MWSCPEGRPSTTNHGPALVAHLTAPEGMKSSKAHGSAVVSGPILQRRTRVFSSKRKKMTVDPERILHSTAV